MVVLLISIGIFSVLKDVNKPGNTNINSTENEQNQYRYRT